MTAHQHCSHPATKLARAACRRRQHSTRLFWEELADKMDFNQLDIDECRAFESAHQNADDTAADQGFEPHTDQWYSIFVATYNETHERLLNELL